MKKNANIAATMGCRRPVGGEVGDDSVLDEGTAVLDDSIKPHFGQISDFIFSSALHSGQCFVVFSILIFGSANSSPPNRMTSVLLEVKRFPFPIYFYV
jgi:hypothetical protein